MRAKDGSRRKQQKQEESLEKLEQRGHENEENFVVSQIRSGQPGQL